MTIFEKTHAALTEYNRTAPERDAVIDQLETREDLDAWLRSERQAEERVRDAFFEDTGDRGSLLSLGEIRRITRYKKPLDNL